MRKKVHSIRISYAEEAVQEPSVKEMCGVCVGPVEKVPIRSFHAQLHGFLSLTLQGQAAAAIPAKPQKSVSRLQGKERTGPFSYCARASRIAFVS